MSLKSKKQSKSSGLYNDYFSTIILHHTVLQLLNKELTKIIGENAASALNYQQGKKVGIALVEQYKGQIDLKQFKKLMPKIAEVGILSGLAPKILYLRWLKNKCTLRVKSTISNKKSSLKNPTCSYISGELVGIAETLTCMKWKCMETKCVSVGDKFDEFVLICME